MSAQRCPECGVEIKPGVKYCDFCGEKVESEAAPGAAPPEERRARGTAGDVLKGVAFLCLVIGLLVYVGNRLGSPEPAPAPPAGGGGKQQAAAACEDAIRARAPAPFRVIAFPATRVAESQGGYAVSGSVDLQSAAGDLQRKRYFCKVRPDGRGGMTVDEGRLY